jgi:F-type H+-transporting ATPase subunit c
MKSTALLGAGLVIGFGTLGPGSGIGNVAGRANDMIGRYPAQRKTIMRTMFIGAAVSESTAIYSLVVSLLLIFAIK